MSCHRSRAGLLVKVTVPLLVASTYVERADAQVNAGGTWSTGQAVPGWTPAPQPGYAQPGYAQPGYAQPGYQTGYPPPGYQPGYAGAPGYAPMGYVPPRYQKATDLEVGTLYAFSVAYGVGTGIWLDAEADINDPGLRFVAPAILGVAAPVGVFFLNQPTLPRGMPAAISAGMAMGVGEGIGIATYQMTTAGEGHAWGFRQFSRSVFIGSTLGGAAGAVAGYYMEPSPRTSLLLGSSMLWGTLIGSAFGFGASPENVALDNSANHDARAAMSLGGLIGYNVAIAGAGAISAVWIPSYESLVWMWGGFGAGVAVSLPVYLFYINSGHDPRRGLIFQGTAGALGLVAGALFTASARDFGSAARHRVAEESRQSKPGSIQITGGGLFPVRDGVGIQLQGVLF